MCLPPCWHTNRDDKPIFFIEAFIVGGCEHSNDGNKGFLRLKDLSFVKRKLILSISECLQCKCQSEVTVCLSPSALKAI